MFMSNMTGSVLPQAARFWFFTQSRFSHRVENNAYGLGVPGMPSQNPQRGSYGV